MTDPENVAAPQILFVDDEATAVKYFQRAIGSLAPVVTAGSVAEGKLMLQTHADSIKVLVSDQRMPGAYGNELLEYAKEHHPDVVRILTTAYSEIEHMVEAVNQGQIYRYLQKPWEITALRMEMKQALAMANLMGEHSQLLREKVMVRRHQLLANRIGNLYGVSAAGGHPRALESYLRIADAIGVEVPELDWMKMDYADLVSAEAFRSRAFEEAVLATLADLTAKHAGTSNKLQPVQDLLRDDVKGDANGLFLSQTKPLLEYMEKAAEETVSAQHAGWLAWLIWLDGQGAAAQVDAREGTWRLTVADAGEALSAERLANWVDNFM